MSHPAALEAPHPGGWFKSSFSNASGACVEINFDGAMVLIRDSKDRGTGPTLTATARQWMAFLDELTGRATPGLNGALSAEINPAKAILLRSTQNGTALTFTHTEWQMFLAGVDEGEFDHPALAASAG